MVLLHMDIFKFALDCQNSFEQGLNLKYINNKQINIYIACYNHFFYLANKEA